MSRRLVTHALLIGAGLVVLACGSSGSDGGSGGSANASAGKGTASGGSESGGSATGGQGNAAGTASGRGGESTAGGSGGGGGEATGTGGVSAGRGGSNASGSRGSNAAGNGGSGEAGTGGEAGSKAGASQGGNGESGGTAGGGGAWDLPDLDPKEDIADLTREQKGELCDWYVSLYGGYAITTECGGGSSSRTPNDQDQCVLFTKYSCPVTVAEYEACKLSMVPSGGCTESDPSCDPIHCN